MSHPYVGLDPRAFWKTAVAQRNPLEIAELAQVKFKIGKSDRVATAGSCFAQHIARKLRANDFNFVDAEPAPSLLPESERKKFGYELYSARYGNVYTSRQLKQLMLRAFGRFEPAERVWASGGRYFDPFRPSIEPGGFESREEVEQHQEAHLRAVRALFKSIDVFVFTLGLTETWASRIDGSVYPTCPGTQAGEFDADKYEFVNLSYEDVEDDMRYVIRKLTKINPDLKIILTVSPVPLAATASGDHVLSATTYSKSVLRAVAGKLATTFSNVQYFPSYEIITAPVFGGAFFEDNRREVRAEGVDFVMKTFFGEVCQSDEASPPDGKRRKSAATGRKSRAAKGAGRSSAASRKRDRTAPVAPTEPSSASAKVADEEHEDTVCDEQILEFYAP